MYRVVIVITVFCALVVACATSPTGRTQLTFMPESQMAAMGVEAFRKIGQDTPQEKDPRINNYVKCVTNAITQLPQVREESADWEVVVFDDKMVNAFALPGGKIGVYKGLLGVAETPSQLAAVIGHEVGHVLAHHGNERVSQQFAASQALVLVQAIMSTNQTANQQTVMGLLGLGAQVGILLPFSRIQESESDEIGLELMARAGFDPRESVTLWQNMARNSDGQPPEFLSTHPSHGTRIQDLQSNMGSAVKLYQQAQSEGRRPGCTVPAIR